ncbi:hypothetical protein K6H09_004543, partial [Candida tropicalis]
PPSSSSASSHVLTPTNTPASNNNNNNIATSNLSTSSSSELDLAPLPQPLSITQEQEQHSEQKASITPHSSNLPQIISSPSSSTSPTNNMSKEDQERILFKEKSLNEIKQQCSRLIHELEGNNNPELIIKQHIKQLNKYNDLKDLALQLISLIANQRKVKINDILNEMNLKLDDNEDNDTTTTTTTGASSSNVNVNEK